MILKGSQRSGAKALADHLMNDRDNDHVTPLQLRGFVADDLHGALSEAYAISKATHCKQFMFSLSLNPPHDYLASEQDFLDAADRAEQALGLDGQPRAIVMHEKEGRRHCHCVWSRIDADEMKAINLPHFKIKLRDLSRDLFLDHDWQLPNGLASYGNKSPLNFTLEEWQIAKRQGLDPREIKQAFQQAWKASDSQSSFKAALQERGYFLCRGDRRGFVALDIDGKVYAIPKWTGLKAKDVREKLGSPDNLESVDATKASIKSKVTDQMRGFIQKAKDRHAHETAPFNKAKSEMVSQHRQERRKLSVGQKTRWQREAQERNKRLNGGLRGLWDRLSGKRSETRKLNQREAFQAWKRDKQQREFMVKEQMKERQKLQRQIEQVRSKHRSERRMMVRDIMRVLKIKLQVKNNQSKSQKPRPNTAVRQKRDRGPSLSP
ncbi:MAG: relaxase/mobilization nuclease domain-containing protein [Cognatishimia sp.]